MKCLFLATLAVFSFSDTGRAQTSQNPARDPAPVNAELLRIQSDLDTVKSQLAQALRLLSQRPAQSGAVATGPVRASIADGPMMGRADAPVTIIEFSDYQCPFCQRFFSTTFAALKAQYIDAGKVRYVFRDSPLDQLHPLARKAAEAAHCAGEQGKYWEMHDALFRNQRDFAPSHLAERAQAVGVEITQFNSCVSSGRTSARVERGLTDAAAAGVRGTPGFVIGITKADGAIEGVPIRGAQPLEVFQRVIDKLLADAVTAPSQNSSARR